MRTPCRERGFALVIPLVMLGVGLVLMLGVVALGGLQLRSAAAFRQIMAAQFPQAAGSSKQEKLMAPPEGWDHAHFASRVQINRSGAIENYAWQICQREQPDCLTAVPPPALVALALDTDPSMLEPCGAPFDNQAVYFRRPDGVITRSAYDLGVAERLDRSDGSFLRGALANQLYPQGMSWWTMLSARLQDLLSGAGKLMVAGEVMDGPDGLARALAEWQPGAASLAGRSAAALEALDEAGSHQLVVMSNAIRLTHSGLGWASCGQTPCVCLERVAAEGLQRGITVQVIGSEQESLRRVAQAGGGALNPAALPGEPAFVNTLATLDGNLYAPFNRSGRLDLTDYDRKHTRYLDAKLKETDAFEPQGFSCALQARDGALYVATDQDELVRLNPAATSCDWLVRGVGGALAFADQVLVVGPDSTGCVTLLGSEPDLKGRYPASCCCVGGKFVYLAQGQKIAAVSLANGKLQAFGYEAGAAVVWLGYDEALAEVWAALSSGAIVRLDQRLNYKSDFACGLKVRRLVNFSWRHRLWSVVVAENAVAVLNEGEQVWQAAFDAERIASCWVAGGQLNLLLQPRADFAGGVTAVLSLDALSGEPLSRRALGSGCWFGPVVDLVGTQLHFISWRGTLTNLPMGDIKTSGRLGRIVRRGA